MPHFYTRDDLCIMISHGSGGIGAAEYNTARYFLEQGYRVVLHDYFAKAGVSKLFWNYEPDFQDAYTVTFHDMLTNIKLPEHRIVHIGFSLGGLLGLLNSEKFYKNFCFYPGVFGLPQNKNFDNTTVIVAEHDNWCLSLIHI